MNKQKEQSYHNYRLSNNDYRNEKSVINAL